jgi:hypothetical protein
MTYRYATLLGLVVCIQHMHTEPLKGAFALSTDSPVCMIPFSRDFVTTTPIAIQVTVDSIADKGAANFTIRAYIDKEKDSLFIGSFSPYPIDKPGKFVLSLRRYGGILAGEQKKGNRKEVNANLKFVLLSYAGKPDIRVHITSIAWLVEGP